MWMMLKLLKIIFKIILMRFFEIDKEYKTIGNDKDSLQHWLRIILKENIVEEISPKSETIRGDKQVIQMLIDWCVEQKKKDWLNIWKWAVMVER